MTSETFRNEVFDYTTEREWNFRACLEAGFESEKSQFFDETRRLFEERTLRYGQEKQRSVIKKVAFAAQRLASKHALKGEVPAIIDFYADWCGPCKMVAPILEELANEYKDKLVIYKVDTEQERELSSVFGIRSIPSILFIPVEGQPMMQAGALPKSVLKNIIEGELIRN